jgi:hypothetical protein
MGLLCFLNTCAGEITGISFVDSTSLAVCDPKRVDSHQVFKGLAGWGKSSGKFPVSAYRKTGNFAKNYIER